MSIVKSRESEAATRNAAWLSGAQSGSNSALGNLLNVYRDYLRAIADQELGSDLRIKASASDVVQDSFLEAARDFKQFTGGSVAEFQGWLRKILLNNIANLGRGFRGTEKRDIAREALVARQGPSSVIQKSIGHDPSASSIAVKKEAQSTVRSAMQQLPQLYQDVIHWRNYDRESFEQIAQRLGRSDEAVRKLWVRALEALQRELVGTDDSGSRNTVR